MEKISRSESSETALKLGYRMGVLEFTAEQFYPEFGSAVREASNMIQDLLRQIDAEDDKFIEGLGA